MPLPLLLMAVATLSWPVRCAQGRYALSSHLFLIRGLGIPGHFLEGSVPSDGGNNVGAASGLGQTSSGRFPQPMGGQPRL
jgi:hypothetical protein